MSKIDPKHRLAVNYYLGGLNKKASAVKAGYSAASTKDVFDHPNVRELIEKRIAKQEEKTDMDREYLLGKLQEIIATSAGDLLEVDEKGRADLNWERLSPALRKSINTVTVDSKNPGGKYAKTTSTVKITTADRLGAIKEAATLLGIREEKKTLDLEDGLIAVLTQRRQINNTPEEG
tara:strand:- start:664 stop:1194 length:531 start_codon:yes stop_codon:yes gene_type:complete